MIYVNPAIGNDNGSGQANSPLKTITVALDRAAPNTVILLAPGTYSIATGEVFPIQLKPTITLQGDPRNRGQNVLIRGGDFFLSRTFARQNVTILGADRSMLAGVTVTNPNPQGYGLWTESTSPVIFANTFTGNTHDGASIVGNSAPVLKNNYFYQNGANGVTVYGTSRPEIQDNIFERTGFGVNIAQNSAPKLLGNRITQNKDGVVVQGSAQPILRNNVIDNNARDGMVSIAQSRPNLGNSADPGNNTFLNNQQFDINTQRTTQTVPAFGNQVSAKTIGRLDFSGIAAPEMTTNVASSTGFGQPRPLPPLAIRSRPLPQARNNGAIEIPVPAATSRSAPLPIARSNRPLPTLRINAAIRPTEIRPTEIRPTEGIPIRIPQVQPQIAQPKPQLVQQPRRVASASGILPVPRATPPIGNTAGTSVRIWRGGSGAVSQASSLGFRFRVIVQASTASEQTQVRSVVADAFALRGRRVMQAGAFRDRAEADELLQILLNQGLQASIEQI
ncbi:hypothetical protein LBWT_42820 [Leptolyngbya boryana IAM M-101]|nr:hypothetical protein LBWT_42820 [Leptolyngbya boryana IAM M-101]BAS64666.1 hypothetical protein LBDG_42820 [Leptolyngbya boryana dg5]